MKKTIKLMGILVVTILLLTGCNFNSEIKLNKDGSADITYTIALTPEELSQVEQSGYSKEDLIQPEGIDDKTGIQTKIYNQDGLEGNTYTKHEDNVKDINLGEIFSGASITTPYDNEEEYKDIETDEVKTPPQFTFKKGFFANKVVLDANMDLSNADYSSYGISQSYNFKLTTKGAIKDSNATTTKGGDCQWDLNFTKYNADENSGGNSLKATIVFYNYLTIGLVVLGVVIIGLVAVIIIKKSGKKGKSSKKAE